MADLKKLRKALEVLGELVPADDPGKRELVQAAIDDLPADEPAEAEKGKGK